MWSNFPEIGNELVLVEDYLRANTVSRNKMLSEVVLDLINAGGKRLRPAFVVISSKFGMYDRKKILPIAGSVEILHSATLVHDDIIDCSKLRRGRVTVSEKYGVDMAIYAGDFLYTKAVLMLSKGVSSDKLEMIAKVIKSICEGEVDQYQERYRLDTSVSSYLKRIRRKTAIFFSVACAVGANAAECPVKVARNLAQFGFNYGMAFQIRDDLNDFISDETRSGKPVGKDLAEGVITLPVIYAIKRNSSLKLSLEAYLEEGQENLRDDIGGIIQAVKESGGIESAKKMMERYIDKGIRHLDALPDNIYSELLRHLIYKLKV